MLKHILVPLDGSQIAEEGLREALQIVDKTTRITLVTAVDIPQPIYSFDMALVTEPIRPVDQDKLLKQARDYLENVIRDLIIDDVQARFVVRLGEPATVINEIADSLNVDMIVMSTHGRSGISRLLFGSTTGKVLSIAKCPVLVVPSRKKVGGRGEKVLEDVHIVS